MTPHEQFLRFMSRGRQRLLREAGGVVRWPLDACDMITLDDTAPGSRHTLNHVCYEPSRVLGLHAVNQNVIIHDVRAGLHSVIRSGVRGSECRYRRFAQNYVVYPSAALRLTVSLNRHCVLHTECNQYPDTIGIRCLSRRIDFMVHVERFDPTHTNVTMPRWYQR